jgi:hypothetical protein
MEPTPASLPYATSGLRPVTTNTLLQLRHVQIQKYAEIRLSPWGGTPSRGRLRLERALGRGGNTLYTHLAV